MQSQMQRELIEEAQSHFRQAKRTADDGMSDEEARKKALALLVYGLYLIGYSWEGAAEIIELLDARLMRPN